MQYAAKILHDNDLPPGSEWCLIREPDLMTLCIKRSFATDPQVLGEAWAAARHSCERLALSA